MTDDMWGTGDFKAVAEKISTAGEQLVESAGIEPGHDVLDVGCGTGNATIPAAKLAARATGLDFSPGLIEIARELGADAMVEVDWIVGDAQDMPFEDDSFDRVISIFGHMFAPDHAAAASELKRVCRVGGGRIAIACWTPEGKLGQMFKRMSALNPPPPEGFQPPVLWVTEDHVRELLGDGARFERKEVEWVDESAEAYARFMEDSFPPLVAARKAVGDDKVHETYLAFLEEVNEAGDGGFRFSGEYLLSVVDV
jgi:ubiquinone/menaquinone biosynthesis C-methylase UbiE